MLSRKPFGVLGKVSLVGIKVQSLIVLGEHFVMLIRPLHRHKCSLNYPIRVFPYNTKLALLSFLYCFVVKGKLISAKSLPPMGIEPATLRP